MSRRRTKEGYLHVKQAGRFGKTWKRKWVVAQPNNTKSMVGELAAPSILLELYVEKGNHGKTVISVLLEGATEVRRVFSKSQSLAFEVKKGDETLLAAAGDSETETQEWVAMFKHQLSLIRKKELTKLPDATEAPYRVSVIPNKYSESHQLSGDVLAHVTSMTFGFYDLYEGTLIKEWDLRHTKKFALQSKGPQKDVDRIAVIQISNRSPYGAGDLHLYSLNAKPFLEEIYENLNSAMDVKSKRTRSASMLFEIPPKELEMLGKEVKEGSKAAGNGADTNGSAPKAEDKTANGPSSKEPSVSSEKETPDEEISFASEDSKEKVEIAKSEEVKESGGEKPAEGNSVEPTSLEDQPDSPPQDEPASESTSGPSSNVTEAEGTKAPTEIVLAAVEVASPAPQQTDEGKPDESAPAEGQEEVVSKEDEAGGEAGGEAVETTKGDVTEPKEQATEEREEAEPSSEVILTDGGQGGEAAGTSNVEVVVHSTDTSSTQETPEESESVVAEATQGEQTEDASEATVTEPDSSEGKDESVEQSAEVDKEGEVGSQVDPRKNATPEDSERNGEEPVQEGLPSVPQEEEEKSQEDEVPRGRTEEEKEEIAPMGVEESKLEQPEAPIGDTPRDDKASGPELEAVETEDGGTQTTFGDENVGENNAGEAEEGKDADDAKVADADEGTSIE